MKEIILKENLIYLLTQNKIIIINDNGEDVEIFDYDIELLDEDKIFIIDDIFIIRKNNVYFYDLEDENLKLIKKFDENVIIGNCGNLFFEAKIQDNEIIIKEYKIEKLVMSFYKENIYKLDSKINPFINDLNILASVWNNKVEKYKEYLTDFISNDSEIIFVKNDELFILDKKLNIFSKVKIPYIKNMESRLILRENFLLICSKDETHSIIISINLDNLERVNIIKKGLDKINSYLSSDAKFLLAGYGDKVNYPMIVNIEKNLPMAVIDLELDDSFNIAANDNLSKILIANSNMLKLYTWMDSKITLEYELDI